MTTKTPGWDDQYYHGWNNRYPFTEVVSFVLGNFGGVPDRSQVRILDLGCGAAHHLGFLALEGFDYYGLDGASKAIEIARERLRAGGFAVDNVITGTFDDLPYEDDFFDAIIDRGALVCNRRSEIARLLVEVKRVLKPGGRLFSMLLNEACSSRATGEHIGDGDYANFKGHLEGAGVLHYTNVDDVADLFKEFKLQDIELEIRKSEYSPKENREVTAWTIVQCTK